MKRFYTVVIILLLIQPLHAQQWYWESPLVGYIESEEDTLAELDNSNDLLTTGILRHWAQSGEIIGERARIFIEGQEAGRQQIPNSPTLLLYPNPFTSHIMVVGV